MTFLSGISLILHFHINFQKKNPNNNSNLLGTNRKGAKVSPLVFGSFDEPKNNVMSLNCASSIWQLNCGRHSCITALNEVILY